MSRSAFPDGGILGVNHIQSYETVYWTLKQSHSVTINDENLVGLNFGEFGELCFLNQARAGCRPVPTWFLKIYPVRIVGMRVHLCVCVCVCACARGY